eukprot:724941_1
MLSCCCFTFCSNSASDMGPNLFLFRLTAYHGVVLLDSIFSVLSGNSNTCSNAVHVDTDFPFQTREDASILCCHLMAVAGFLDTDSDGFIFGCGSVCNDGILEMDVHCLTVLPFHAMDSLLINLFCVIIRLSWFSSKGPIRFLSLLMTYHWIGLSFGEVTAFNCLTLLSFVHCLTVVPFQTKIFESIF